MLRAFVQDKIHYGKNIKFNCPVCGNLIFIDSVRNGKKCQHCGWEHSRLHEEVPNRVMCPNFISLNKAKKLYKDGKPFTPDFNDFIAGYDFYGEMEFTYKGVTHGLMETSIDGVEFWEMGTDTFEVFKDINEFKEKAKINENF